MYNESYIKTDQEELKGIKYSLTENKLRDEENNLYNTYGITLINSKIHIKDVNTDKKLVVNIVNLLNKHKASPVHLFDIIYDMIA